MPNRLKNTPRSPVSCFPSNYTRDALDKLYTTLKRFLGHTSVLRYPYTLNPVTTTKM